MEDERSETQDSCYYPRCRKDANCNCEICLASINATLDLMPVSVHKTILTKLSSSRAQNNDVERTPISFNALILSTPTTEFSPYFGRFGSQIECEIESDGEDGEE